MKTLEDTTRVAIQKKNEKAIASLAESIEWNTRHAAESFQRGGEWNTLWSKRKLREAIAIAGAAYDLGYAIGERAWQDSIELQIEFLEACEEFVKREFDALKSAA